MKRTSKRPLSIILVLALLLPMLMQPAVAEPSTLNPAVYSDGSVTLSGVLPTGLAEMTLLVCKKDDYPNPADDKIVFIDQQTLATPDDNMTWNAASRTFSINFDITDTTPGLTYAVQVNGDADATVAYQEFTIPSATSTAPVFTDTQTTFATVAGTALTPYTFTASGDPTPTFIVKAGSTLPAGLSLSSAGVLSGTPTAAGTFTVVISATNSAGSVDKSITITVTAAGTAPVFTDTATSVSLIAGVTMSTYTFKASGSPAPKFTVKSGSALPAGLTLSNAGVLSGNPTTPGNYTVVVTAANSAGSVNKSFAIKVLQDTNRVILYSKSDGSYSRTASGNNIVYSFKANAGRSLLNVFVNGRCLGKQSSYTTAASAGESIRVVFATPNVHKCARYIDVSKSDWAYSYICFCAENELMSGSDVPNDPTKFAFKGDNTLTRGEAVQVLANLYGANLSAYKNISSFADVAKTDWFAPAVAWASEKKLVGGSNGKFLPKNPISRQEFMAIVYRFAKFVGADLSATASLDRFSDSAKVQSWAVSAVKWTVGTGIIGGSNGLLKPLDPIIRKEVAKIFAVMSTKIKPAAAPKMAPLLSAGDDLDSVALTLANNDINIGATITPMITAKSVSGDAIDLSAAGATVTLVSGTPAICAVNAPANTISGVATGTAQLTLSVTLSGITKTSTATVNVLNSSTMTSAWASKVAPASTGGAHSIGGPHSGIVTVEYDVTTTNLTANNAEEALVGLFNSTATVPTSYSSGELSALLRVGPADFTGNTGIYWYAGATVINPQKGQTYHIRQVVDTAAGKHWVYVNEKPVLVNQATKNTNCDTISRMVVMSKTVDSRITVENVWVNGTTYYSTPVNTTVASVESSTATVESTGTTATLDLPTEVLVTMANQSVRRMSVVWDTSTFSPSTFGEQTLTGTIQLVAGVVNPSSVKASIVLDVIAAKAATPTANVAAGDVLPGTQVTLTSATPGAEIRYTLDGSEPTATSTLYTTPIAIIDDVTIKACAYKTGLDVSYVATFAYTANYYDQSYEKVFDQGAYCWIGDPRSLRNVNPVTDSDKTYIGCIDINGVVKALQYDNKTGESSNITLRTGFEKDDHDNPSFFVLPDGRVMVFYSKHGAEEIMYYRVTTQPDDLNTLGVEKQIAVTGYGKVCYPAPFYLTDVPNSFFLCFRGVNWHPTITKFSLPDASGNIVMEKAPTQIVQAPGAQVNSSRPYTKYESDGKGKISIMYTTNHPDNDYPNWLYYNVIDVQTWNLLDVKGNVCANIASAPFPISKTETFKTTYPYVVVDSTPTSRNWVWQLSLDDTQTPHILMVGINNAKDVHTYYYVKWTGTEWRKTFLSDGGKWFHQNASGLEKCYSGGLSMNINDLNTIYASRPENGKYGSVYEIVKIVIDDDGNVISETPVTHDSPTNNMRPYVVYGAEPTDKYHLIWMHGNYTYWTGSSYNTSIYAMKNETATATVKFQTEGGTPLKADLTITAPVGTYVYDAPQSIVGSDSKTYIYAPSKSTANITVTTAGPNVITLVYDPVKVVSCDAVEVVTTAGVAPVMPTHVPAHFNDGTTDDVAVVWDAIPAASYAAEGTFTVNGTAGGVAATATVVVESANAMMDVTNMKLKQGGADISAASFRQGPATLTADIYNDGAATRSAKLIVALYDEDHNLLSATTKTVTVASKQTLAAELAVDLDNADAKLVKAMIWNNLTAIKPYHTALAVAASDENYDCTIEYYNASGALVDTVTDSNSATLTTTSFAYGEKLRFSAPGAQYLWVKANNNLEETLLYSPTGFVEFHVPASGSQASYGFPYDGMYGNNNIFKGAQTITMRVATYAETLTYRNLAINPIDMPHTQEVNAYDAPLNANPISSTAVAQNLIKSFPHAYANRVNRLEGSFYARNVIDGISTKGSHGNYPYHSWSGGKPIDFPDQTWMVYFGREVEVDKLVLTLRSDYTGATQHDSYFEAVVIEFSDGSEITVAPTKSGDPQTFTFPKRTTEWVRLKKLIPFVTASSQMYVAINELEVWGTDHPVAKPAAPVSDVSMQEVLDKTNLVNGYYQANFTVGNNLWENGVYHSGNMAAFPVFQNLDFYDFSYRCAVSFNWILNNGSKPGHGDYYVLGQSYLDLFKAKPAASKIASAIQVGNWFAAGSIAEDYDWVDLFYMSMPFAVELSNITGDPKYAEKAYELYMEARDTVGLYDTEDHLWYRDARFIYSPTTEFGDTPNGKKVFWSRGNGWVFAGLAKVLAAMPERDQMYTTYLEDFKAQAAALKACQRSDGFWDASLADPDDHGGKESTGTLAFLYGFAYGIRAGILDYDTYYPTLKKTWDAMSVAGQGLSSAGRIQYCQDVANRPEQGTPAAQGTTKNYAYGFFMLAAAEMLQLSPDYVPLPKATVPNDVEPEQIPTNFLRGGMTAVTDSPKTAQAGNDADCMINGLWADGASNSTGTRWGVENFPSSATITFTNLTSLSKIIVVPYQRRNYTYSLYTSTDGTNFTKLADSDGHFDLLSGFSKYEVSVTNVKAVRITVTGITGTSTPWISINEILFYN